MNQKTALGILKTGRNVFLTGSAGTGKTFVINQYIEYVKDHGMTPAIVAPTGIAASHIGGITIHSFFGLGIKEQLSKLDLKHLSQSKHLAERLSHITVLIIDEISMVSPALFETMDTLLRIFKKSDKPFGGIQIIVSGDFFQLPPISSSRLVIKYAFQTDLWQSAGFKICYLTKKYRQDDDILSNALDEIRGNAVSQQTIDHFHACQTTQFAKMLNVTKLYTHNVDVDQINNNELDKLPHEVQTFYSASEGKVKDVQRIFNTCFAVPELQLKQEAVVLFIKNNPDRGYINGTLGKIVGFDTDSGYPVVETFAGDTIVASPVQWEVENKTGDVVATIHQVPLKLAWAITVHKSQGMTIDAAQIDLSKTFEIGQGYVALSRLKSIEGLQLLGFNTTALSVDAMVLRQDEYFKQYSAFVESQFNDFSKEEKKELYKNFIVQSGGVLKKIKRFKEKRAIKKKASTLDETIALVKQLKSIEAIANERNLKTKTILDHLEKIAKRDTDVDLSYLAPDKRLRKRIQKAVKTIEKQNDPNNFLDNGQVKLRAVFELLNEEVEYDTIRLCLMLDGAS